MAKRNKTPDPRERQWTTFRLWPEDRELLRSIAEHSEDTPDRYTALQQLLPIIQQMEVDNVRGRERAALRLGIPKEVHQALEARSKATGHTITDLLLLAARQYVDRQSTAHEDAD